MRVLIVEAKKSEAASLKRALHAESFTVHVADSAVAADELIEGHRFDLIVLGLNLPDYESFALLHGWRQQGLSLPILALAAGDQLNEKIRALELGADATLVRPVAVVELLAHVRALVRRAHRIYDPLLLVHDLEIDTNTRTVRRGGQAIHLTRKQYALLQFLAFHRGRVVSRSMICEHLYAGDGENTSNVVDVFIRYLRGKIDKGFAVPLILTRWGEGYLLRGEDDWPADQPRGERLARA